MSAPTDAGRFAGTSAWSRNLGTPLRDFLRTETSGAAVLLAAAAAGLVWANVDLASYERLWTTRLAIQVGGATLALDLRHWVNGGLMTLFFFVVGLEARREFDLGELREHRRFGLPLAAGLGGMGLAIGLYLAFNARHGNPHGWGAAMSTDTAFALGLLALVGPRFPGRLRAFLLTVMVVDDLAALLVITTVYAGDVTLTPLVGAVALFAAVLAAVALGVRNGFLYAGLAAAIWVCLVKAGVEPVVVGLAMGLMTWAYPAARSDLERATERFRQFREQPTPELARSARESVRTAISPNARLQALFHPWTSYVIVPLFALANVGIPLDGAFLRQAAGSRITLGILVGYVAGKPIGIVGVSWVVSRLSRGRLRPPVGWAAVAGGGTIAGIGFTVSLLVATLAFRGPELAQAKAGVLAAALLAALLTWMVFRAAAALPRPLRLRALMGTAEPPVDLYVAVDSDRDHVRGPREAPVTIVEYGDFECPYCGQAEDVLRDLLRDFGDVRYVWRHLPLTDVHPSAQLAAEASEAAAEQGAFWEMHDRLLANQQALTPGDLVDHAAALGLDVDRFERDLAEHAGAARVADDVDSADLSGVTGTPTFFVNARRHHGAYDIESLARAVRAAGARASLAAG
jgi:Na+/H+ antiporter NhaA